MTAPARVECAADTWVLVAENVTSGQLHRLEKSPNLYLQTYVDTGDAAPTDDNTAVPVFVGGESVIISNVSAIDVYIKAVGAAGAVRADL